MEQNKETIIDSPREIECPPSGPRKKIIVEKKDLGELAAPPPPSPPPAPPYPPIGMEGKGEKEEEEMGREGDKEENITQGKSKWGPPGRPDILVKKKKNSKNNAKKKKVKTVKRKWISV